MEMDKAFFDNPEEVDLLVDNMSSQERESFDKGYVYALCQLLDQITVSQSKLQAKMMEYEDDEEALIQLQSRMILLDVYENFYRRRVKTVVDRQDLHT